MVLVNPCCWDGMGTAGCFHGMGWVRPRQGDVGRSAKSAPGDGDGLTRQRLAAVLVHGEDSHMTPTPRCKSALLCSLPVAFLVCCEVLQPREHETRVLIAHANLLVCHRARLQYADIRALVTPHTASREHMLIDMSRGWRCSTFGQPCTFSSEQHRQKQDYRNSSLRTQYTAALE